MDSKEEPLPGLASPDTGQLGGDTGGPPSRQGSEDEGLARRQAISKTAPVLAVHESGEESYIFSAPQEMKTEGRPSTYYFVHGLPVEFVNILGVKFKIDRDFIEAHYARRAYRPFDSLIYRGYWMHWMYPELVTGVRADAEANEHHLGGGIVSNTSDIMSEPAIKALGSGDSAAVFCRASIWRDFDWDSTILFLDKAPWCEKGSSLRKMKRGSAITKPEINDRWTDEIDRPWKVMLSEGDEIRDLEEDLRDMMKDSTSMERGLINAVARLAYGRWLEFFDSLSMSDSSLDRNELMSLLWQVLGYLEQNADVAAYSCSNALSCPDVDEKHWKSLIQRTQHRLEVISRTMPVPKEPGQGPKDHEQQDPDGPRGAKRPRPSTEGMYNHARPPLDLDEINRRNMDRITYLGGILLPLTVVSGILGIKGRYGPEGHQFWVFWAAAVVSSAVCLLIIYLDQVRGLEVWFEVATNDTIETMFPRSPKLGRDNTNNTMKLSGLEPGSQGTTGSMPHMYTAENGDVAIRVDEGMQVVVDSSGAGEPPTIWFHRSQSGASCKTWRKRQLGWGGAVKKTVGYYHFRGGKVRFERPGADDD